MKMLKTNKNVLPHHTINYILFQMLGFTFLCAMLFVDIFIDREITWLKLSLLTFTILSFILYEIIFNLIYSKVNNRIKMEHNESVEEEDIEGSTKGYHEKYLWFISMLLIDIVIIVYLIATYTALSDIVSLFVGILIYYLLTLWIRPYFGVHHGTNATKDNDEEL